MSIYNRVYLGADGKSGSAQHIRITGPTIPISISVPKALAAELIKEGKPVPPPEQGMALLDTGASITMIDEVVLQKLNINSLGKASVVGAAADKASLFNKYPAAFSFPGTNLPEIDYNSVVSNPALQAQQKIVALIGRDILMYGILIYNGVAGAITLSLDPNQNFQKGSIKL
jgi:predicted aspartyl protease